MNDAPVLLCMIARIPKDGIAAFAAYEARVLPLLSAHGGVLERRLAAGDGTTEVHIVRFASLAGIDRYRALPERSAAQSLLVESGAAIETLIVGDVA